MIIRSVNGIIQRLVTFPLVSIYITSRDNDEQDTVAFLEYYASLFDLKETLKRF